MGAEGDLSFTPDSSSADFDYEEPFHSCVLYYYAHGPILLIDPDVENASKPDHSDVDASPLGISIIEGDRSCVATHMKRSSYRAAHWSPQSQGSQYIEAFTKERGGDIVYDIDDPRNGLLVNRCYIDSFAEMLPIFRYGERSAWPTHRIFAAVYASALLTSWSAQDSLTQVRSHWSNSFYPEAQRSRDEAECKARSNPDNRIRQADAFDVLLMLREIAAHSAFYNASPSESQSAQKDNDDVREKVLPCLHGVR